MRACGAATKVRIELGVYIRREERVLRILSRIGMVVHRNGMMK